MARVPPTSGTHHGSMASSPIITHTAVRLLLSRHTTAAPTRS